MPDHARLLARILGLALLTLLPLLLLEEVLCDLLILLVELAQAVFVDPVVPSTWVDVLDSIARNEISLAGVEKGALMMALERPRLEKTQKTPM